MYIGHYGIALAAKKAAPTIPLWLLFVAVQLPDLVAFVLILCGVETVHSVGGDNPFYRTTTDQLPYSHALICSLVVAALAAAIPWKSKKRLWAAMISLAVLSHWGIDVLFQKASLPIYPGGRGYGLGLWDYPLFSFAAEIAVVVGASLVLDGDRRIPLNRPLLAATTLIMSVFFAFVMLVPEPHKIAESPRIKTLVILVPYLAFTLLAVFIDRRRGDARKAQTLPG